MITIVSIWIWGIVFVAAQVLMHKRDGRPPGIVLFDVLCWPFWLLVNLVGRAAEFALESEDDDGRR